MTPSAHASTSPKQSEISKLSMGEGDTPCVRLPYLERWLGIAQVYAKLENLNPTGSYKDRIAVRTIAFAKSEGYLGWIATSSGNAGASLAAYGARAGIPGVVCVVDGAPAEKVLGIQAYQPHILPVKGIGVGGDPEAAERLFHTVEQIAQQHHLLLAVTAHKYNARGMQGADRIGLELAMAQPHPTHVYVPSGGGGLAVSVSRGMVRSSCDAKVVTCQPDGCAPISGFISGELPAPRVSVCETDISALQLPSPPDGALAARWVAATNGWGTRVSDSEILQAHQLLATKEGLFVEPAAAASVACLARDVSDGRLAKGARPVVLLTGSGLRDLNRVASWKGADQPVSVDELASFVGKGFL